MVEERGKDKEGSMWKLLDELGKECNFQGADWKTTGITLGNWERNGWNVATVVTKEKEEFPVPRTLFFLEFLKGKVNVTTNLHIPGFYKKFARYHVSS